MLKNKQLKTLQCITYMYGYKPLHPRILTQFVGRTFVPQLLGYSNFICSLGNQHYQKIIL